MFRGTNSWFRRLYSQGCVSAQLGARPIVRCCWSAGWWRFHHCWPSVTTCPDKTKRRCHTTIFKNRMNVFYIQVNKISISGNLGSERLTALFYNLPVEQAAYSILAVTKSSKADCTQLDIRCLFKQNTTVWKLFEAIMSTLGLIFQ